MGFLDLFKKKKEIGNRMYLYTEEELEKYDKFIREQYGDYEEVLHELMSDGIHLDIVVIPPTKEENYYKLVTMGMGLIR